jgi:hypothetical protein
MNEIPERRRTESVEAYRLSSVEASIRDLHAKLDNLLVHYATKEYVLLLVNPLSDKVKDLESVNTASSNNGIVSRNQMKVALLTICLSPVIAVIVGLLLGHSR